MIVRTCAGALLGLALGLATSASAESAPRWDEGTAPFPDRGYVEDDTGTAPGVDIGGGVPPRPDVETGEDVEEPPRPDVETGEDVEEPQRPDVDSGVDLGLPLRPDVPVGHHEAGWGEDVDSGARLDVGGPDDADSPDTSRAGQLPTEEPESCQTTRGHSAWTAGLVLGLAALARRRYLTRR